MSEKVIWVLTDDRAGNVSQCMGVAEALGLPFARIDINYNSLAKLPNALLGRHLTGLNRESRDKITAPWPDAVIAAGRRTAPVARYIRKQSKNQTQLFHIMNPGATGSSDFDMIFIPAHDQKKLETNEQQIIGAPHRVSEDKLLIEKDRWAPSFATLPSPRIAVIVGGATKNRAFTSEMSQALGRQINELATKTGGSILLTTSRRTGDAAADLIKEIHVPSSIYQWGDTGENPYFGYLACADDIIVTGDSVSMCSEACSTGKPVAIYAPEDMISAKHQRMVSHLVEGGYAQKFDGNLPVQKAGRLNTTQEIADKINSLLD